MAIARRGVNDKTEKSWWAKIRVGLVTDPKHEKKMGKALWLYLHLHMYADRNGGKLMRKYETIAKETGRSVSTVKRRMKKLEREGYIRLRRMQHGFSIDIEKYNLPDNGGRETTSDIQIGQFENPDRSTTVREGKSDLSGSGGKQREKCSDRSEVTPSKESIKESIKESTPPVPSKKQKKTKKTNPDIKKAIDHFHNEFLRIHGFKPEINGAHGKIFGKLLTDSGKPIEQLKDLTTAFLESDDPYLIEEVFPIGLLPGQITKLEMQMRKNGQEPTEEEIKKREEQATAGHEALDKKFGMKT